MRRPTSSATARSTTQISQTIVDQQQDLDEFLVSSIGLADIGNDVIGGNRQALTDVLHLLVPTTDLLNQYHEALWCAIGGLAVMANSPPLPVTRRRVVSAGLTLGSRAISLSGGPAEGRRQGRPVLQGTRPAQRSPRVPGAVHRR